MYLIHLFRCTFNRNYRRIVVKHELSEKYDSVTYNWRKVLKEYNKQA